MHLTRQGLECQRQRHVTPHLTRVGEQLNATSPTQLMPQELQLYGTYYSCMALITALRHLLQLFGTLYSCTALITGVRHSIRYDTINAAVWHTVNNAAVRHLIQLYGTYYSCRQLLQLYGTYSRCVALNTVVRYDTLCSCVAYHLIMQLYGTTLMAAVRHTT